MFVAIFAYLILAYLILSFFIAVGAGAAINASWTAGVFALVATYLAWQAGSFLKIRVWCADRSQSLVGSIVVVAILLSIILWISGNFGVRLFGYVLSGAVWTLFGVAVGLVSDERLIHRHFPLSATPRYGLSAAVLVDELPRPNQSVMNQTPTFADYSAEYNKLLAGVAEILVFLIDWIVMPLMIVYLIAWSIWQSV